MRLPQYIVVGRHQIMALLLLAAFAAQCGWLIKRRAFTLGEQDHIWSGRQQLEYNAAPRKFQHTPLINIASAAPLKINIGRQRGDAVSPESVQREVRRLHILTRLPFVLAGILLGVSVWYVARRLYGNPGGYIALILYCFSPAIILRASTIDEVVPSAWGVFGIIFGAIAISHNLYAPWRKWRYRTMLLSVAMALAVASHPAAMLLVPVGLGFILYLAPGRRVAGAFLTFAACAIAFVLVLSTYNAAPRAMMNGIDLRQWLVYQPAVARQEFFPPDFLFSLLNPAVLVMAVVALITYMIWKRSRYFGNTSPLIVALGLLYLALITPMTGISAIWALPFVFVFIGGIWADLLETRRKWVAAAAVMILLGENAWYCWKLLQAA
ncbi:MAG TPA: glycosyltransferase family 39 protein [Terriglobales bacterium]|nr:glycosyltransferase family 39 protein [Terriglobales bacterium]